MNEDIKLFFIDLDGTTLDTKTADGQHWVSEENLDAIKRVKKEKKHVIVSTGRIGVNVKKFYELIGGEYLVAGNGAQILDSEGNVVLENKLTVQQVLKVFMIVQKYKLLLKLDDSWDAYGAFTPLQKMMSKTFGLRPIEGYFFEMHKERYKLIVWGKTSKHKLNKIIDEINAEVPDVSVVTSTNGWTLEISHANATKGKANAWVAEQLHIAKEETVHIGDTMNDSTAVNYVGRLIVMNNGDRNLKKLSPYRGPSYKNSGLAKVLSGEYSKIEPGFGNKIKFLFSKGIN